MKRIIASSFVLSALATGVLVYPKLSQAGTFWSRHSQTECNTVAGSGEAYVDGGNTSSSGSMILYCRAHDTAAQLRGSVTWVNVHVEDNSPSAIQSALCIKHASATSGVCGDLVPTSGTGQKVLNPPTFAQWTNAAFGYIYVLLPPRGTGISSKLNGYSMGD
jgi:hypothetical protein